MSTSLKERIKLGFPLSKSPVPAIREANGQQQDQQESTKSDSSVLKDHSGNFPTEASSDKPSVEASKKEEPLPTSAEQHAVSGPRPDLYKALCSIKGRQKFCTS